MEAKDLKLGDKVCLNSSSPKMTVSNIDGDYISVVQWNYNTFQFDVTTLHVATVFKAD